MDQSANAEKPNLNADRGHIEVIETSRAFPRPGIVFGNDGLRHPLRYVAWAGFHCVSLPDAIRAHARRRSNLQPAKVSTRNRQSCPTESHGIDARQPSLNSEPGCIKVVDTFRAAIHTACVIRPVSTQTSLSRRRLKMSG
jgi:hypothetical protein